MRPLQYLYLCLLLVALPVFSAEAQQTATVTGTVTDATEGFRLGGANLVLLDAQAEEMITGAATGADGNYRITGIAPGDYVLAFRFVGYREERVPLTLSAGESRTVNIALTATGLDLNTVVVTASRQEEKVLDAPASISVLDAREIAANVVLSSAAVLRNTTGLDLAQTGIDRYEIVLRGFNNAFSGAAYVLTDYR
ncbi:MAG: carboxypeptidase regulatory-like domain-containing protein, partial [Rhodothermales bacterium]